MDDINSTLQNIARQLAAIAQSDQNAFPPATSTTSPQSTGVSVGTAAGVLVAENLVRHGILFHNPGTDADVYVFPTDNAVTTSSLAGSIQLSVGSTLALPSAQFPNVTCGWSAVGIGTTLPTAFTVLEFF